MRNKYKVVDNYFIVYMHNRKKEIFEMLIDLKYLQKMLDFDVTWYPFYDTHNYSYYGRTTIYKGIFDGKPSYELLLNQSFLYQELTEGNKLVPDHINHNTLDNREENIRIISNTENTRNRIGRNKNNKSGIRNMCWIDGWLRLQLQIEGKNHLFPEKFNEKQLDEAREFASKMRKKYYGDFAGND